MKTMSVGNFKTQFSKVLEWIKKGNKVAVTYGKDKKIVGYFVPTIYTNTEKRSLGILEGKAKAKFHNDFKISEEEFLHK